MASVTRNDKNIPMTTHFTILLAGDITPTLRLFGQVHNTRTIAADGGIRHARTLNLVPELWVGDFDSAVAADGDAYTAMERQTHPPAKDATDGDLAIAAAIARGASHMTLVGAFGGRTDHAFAILANAYALSRRGLTLILSSGREEAHPLSSLPTVFDFTDGTQFSVLGFSALKGLTLTGAQWPLEAHTVPLGDTIVISNRVAGKLTASVAEGQAMLIANLIEDYEDKA